MNVPTLTGRVVRLEALHERHRELLRPMAVVVLGGIATSTLLSLFIVPTLYPLFTSSPEPGTSSEPIGDQPAFEPTPG